MAWRPTPRDDDNRTLPWGRPFVIWTAGARRPEPIQGMADPL